MSQCQRSRFPASRRASPRLNQNLAVMAGSTKASKTSAMGRRISLGDDLCDGSHGKSSMGVGKGAAAASGGRSRLMAQAGYFSFRA